MVGLRDAVIVLSNLNCEAAGEVTSPWQAGQQQDS